jgi:hypothetical protein
MPPRRRGTAQPVKKSKRDKYKTVGSDSEEVTPSSESADEEFVPKVTTRQERDGSKVEPRHKVAAVGGSGSLPTT